MLGVVAQLVRAPFGEDGGQRFESFRHYKKVKYRKKGVRPLSIVDKQIREQVP